MSLEGRQPDIYFAPTPERVVQEMLRITGALAGDLIYDLGCGDGRILVTAATTCGARGFGVDIDPELLSIARLRAANAGLNSLIHFERQDFFRTDLSPASIITLYLLDTINVRLRPNIFAQCRPGTKVVSYSFEMGEWEADDHIPIAANGVSLWIVPANLTGTWRVQETSGTSDLVELRLRQKFQKLSGEAIFKGQTLVITGGRVSSDRFEVLTSATTSIPVLKLTGQIDDETIQANFIQDGQENSWLAKRQPGSDSPLEV